MSDQSLSLPAPADPIRKAVWTGDDFVIDGRHERILMYDVAPSGWTDELTQIHEEIGGGDHFIETASRGHAIAEIERCVPSHASTILEIGCSSGFLLKDINRILPQHSLVGADYTVGTLRALASRVPGIPLVQFDLTRCPLPDSFADVSVLLNVLEHIGDHEAAMRHLFRITKPGGAVVIELPACSTCYDVYDRVLMHHRRYDMPELCALLEKVGFVIDHKSHLGFFLFPAFYLTKRINQIRYPKGGKFDEQELVKKMMGSAKSSPLMKLIMRIESALRPYVYYPFGIRCLVTCRRPA